MHMYSHSFIHFLIIALVFVSNAFAADPNYFSPEHVEGSVSVSVDEAKELFDAGVVFVDVRNPRLFKRKHIPNSYHLDLKNGFEKAALEKIVGKNEPVVIYSSSIHCSRSYKAVARAVAWGFGKVYYFRGGIADWKHKQLPFKYPDYLKQ